MDDLARLKEMLRRREGKRGYSENAEALKRRIAELEGRNAG